MVDESLNYNACAYHQEQSDAHGQAALLLTESLIHSLITRSVLTVEEAIEVVQTAVEVEAERAEEWGDSPATLQKSLALLKVIGNSLKTDLPAGLSEKLNVST